MKRIATLTLAGLVLAACEDPTEPQVDRQPETWTPGFALVVGSEIQVTNSTYFKQAPSISGTRVAWEDNRPARGIYVYDASTGTERQITTTTGGGSDISGDRVVTKEYRNYRWDVAVYNVVTGARTQITNDYESHWGMVIDGDWIGWAEQPRYGGPIDIVMFDLLAWREYRHRPPTSPNFAMGISGDRIVWADRRSGNWDIFMYEVGAGETRITSHLADQEYPAISGDRIVWADRRNGNWDIYMYNLASGIETRITSDPADQRGPAISGDYIVWEDRRTGNQDIFLYNLTAGDETQVTTHPGSDFAPDISGDWIAWKAYRGGQGDIYMVQVREPAPLPPLFVDLIDLVASLDLEAWLEDDLTRLVNKAGREFNKGQYGPAVRYLLDFRQGVVEATDIFPSPGDPELLIAGALEIVGQVNPEYLRLATTEQVFGMLDVIADLGLDEGEAALLRAPLEDVLVNLADAEAGAAAISALDFIGLVEATNPTFSPPAAAVGLAAVETGGPISFPPGVAEALVAGARELVWGIRPTSYRIFGLLDDVRELELDPTLAEPLEAALYGALYNLADDKRGAVVNSLLGFMDEARSSLEPHDAEDLIDDARQLVGYVNPTSLSQDVAWEIFYMEDKLAKCEIPAGLENSLTGKLHDTLVKLADAKVDEAVEKLEGFIVEVGTLSPEYIPEDVAERLIRSAEYVIDEVSSG